MVFKALVRALFAIFLGAAPALSMGSTADLAQNGWPNRPIRIIVGFPGGSSPDLTARALAEPLSKALGQPVLVDNKVGASGNIAADAVAKATDGHTLGLMINSNLTIAKLLNPKLPFDPHKDLTPISLIATSPMVLTVPAGAPGHTSAEWLAAAQQSGSRWNYGTPGIGTVGHLGMELLKARASLGAQHVPYPGYPQVAAAMMGGDVQLALLPPALALSQIRAGKLRGIGVTASVRSGLAPDIPSLAELGILNLNLEIWNAVVASSSLPKPVAARLSALISEIARTPEMRQKLLQQGWTVAGTAAEGLTKRMQADTATLGAIIQSQKIAIE